MHFTFGKVAAICSNHAHLLQPGFSVTIKLLETLPSKKSFQAFTIKYDVSCGIFIVAFIMFKKITYILNLLSFFFLTGKQIGFS